MPITKDLPLPSYEELEVEEVPLASAFLKAGAFHLVLIDETNKYCVGTCVFEIFVSRESNVKLQTMNLCSAGMSYWIQGEKSLLQSKVKYKLIWF